MTQLFTNNAIDLLAPGGLAIDGMQFGVRAGKGNLFPLPVNPDDFFLVTLENENGTCHEIIKVKERHGDLFVVGERGYEGTTVYQWPELQTVVDHRLTAGTMATLTNLTKNIYSRETPLSVAPNSSVSSDVFLVTAINRTCKWLVTVLDNATLDAMMIEILAISRGSSRPPAFSRYAQVGDKIDVGIDVVQNGDALELIITNNTSVTLITEAVRITNFK